MLRRGEEDINIVCGNTVTHDADCEILLRHKDDTDVGLFVRFPIKITMHLSKEFAGPLLLGDIETDVVNVKDYYARGDGKGASPSDEGVDISNEPWNNWTK